MKKSTIMRHITNCLETDWHDIWLYTDLMVLPQRTPLLVGVPRWIQSYRTTTDEVVGKLFDLSLTDYSVKKLKK